MSFLKSVMLRLINLMKRPLRFQQRIEALQSEVAHWSNRAIFSEEEAGHLRDLNDLNYTFDKNKVGNKVRSDEEIASIRVKIEGMGPWQAPYDFGNSLRTLEMRNAPAGASSEQIERFRQLSTQDEDFFRHRATRLFHAIEAYIDPKESTLIDIGCSDGYFSIEAAKRGYKEVVGLDVRKDNIDRARYAAEIIGLDNVQFDVDNIYELSKIKSRKFDIVVCMGLMYHLTHPVLAAQKLFKASNNITFIAGWTAIGEGAKLDLRLDDESFFLDSEQAIVAIPTYEGLRWIIKNVGYKNVLEVKRPGLSPTGEWREFIGFVR